MRNWKLVPRDKTPATFEARCISPGCVAASCHSAAMASKQRLARRPPRASRSFAEFRHEVLGALFLILFAGFVVSCSDPVEPVEFNTHPAGWAEENSDNFHGTFVLESPGKTASCENCHGDDYQGAVSGVSCFSSGCHTVFPHPEGFGDATAGGLHTSAVAEDFFWDLSACKTCHGADYAGRGYPEKSCLTCHTGTDGPETCNTCHGSANSVAPPEDLAGNSSTTSPGVGAHQTHLSASDLTDVLGPACSHCHADVTSFPSAGHIDGGPASADVVFSSFATSDGELATVYDPSTATCSNVYCHGGFEFLKSESTAPFVYTGTSITGNNLLMEWTDVGTNQAECGTCHGLPPTGHTPIPTCSGCHPRVVDGANNIIGPDLHINGEIDVF